MKLTLAQKNGANKYFSLQERAKLGSSSLPLSLVVLLGRICTFEACTIQYPYVFFQTQLVNYVTESATKKRKKALMVGKVCVCVCVCVFFSNFVMLLKWQSCKSIFSQIWQYSKYES
jgi:hypothetical protein